MESIPSRCCYEIVCLLGGASLAGSFCCLEVGCFFSVGVFVTKLDCGVDSSSLARLFTRCKRMTSTEIVSSERANHSGNCNFIRVTSRRTNGGTVSTLGRTRVSNEGLTMSMTHPGRRSTPHHDCGNNNGHNNNCNNNGHNNNCNNNHSECWSSRGQGHCMHVMGERSGVFFKYLSFCVFMK